MIRMALLCLALGMGSYSHALTGRVVDEGRGFPVAGAVVAHVGGPEKVTTDANGRFQLLGSVYARKQGAPSAGIALVQGNLRLDLAREAEIVLEWHRLNGMRAGSECRRLGKGIHLLPLTGAAAGASAGGLSFLKVRAGESHGVFRLLGMSGHAVELPARRQGPAAPADDKAMAEAGAASGAVAKAGAALAGQIAITCKGLLEARAEFAVAGDDLGDIVMRYPPRRTGVGVSPVYGAKALFDGTRKSLDDNWEMWQSPWRLSQNLPASPVNWDFVQDPAGEGMVMAAKPLHTAKWYGRHDLVTKAKYRDFQAHVEFNVSRGGNSGVYLQNRYEVQVTDGGGVGQIYGEANPTSNRYAGTDKWNAYDITFRAARWNGNVRTKKALISVWWNGQQVHRNVEADKTHGMDFQGEEGQGFVPGGEPVDSTLQGLKFQNHGSVVRFRNAWILELDIVKEDTDFGY